LVVLVQLLPAAAAASQLEATSSNHAGRVSVTDSDANPLGGVPLVVSSDRQSVVLSGGATVLLETDVGVPFVTNPAGRVELRILAADTIVSPTLTLAIPSADPPVEAELSRRPAGADPPRRRRPEFRLHRADAPAGRRYPARAARGAGGRRRLHADA